MKNDAKFARQSNLGALHPAPFRHLERPALQAGKARRSRQHDMCRLKECGSHHGVADLADAPIPVGLAGLVFLRRESEVGAGGTGFSEPCRIIHCRALGQGDKCAYTGRAHQLLANLVGTGDPEHLAVEPGELAPQR